MTDGLPSETYLIPNGAFGQEHYGATYLIDGEELILVDPGTSKTIDRLFDWFAESTFSLDQLGSILLTHIHLDHAGATGHLVDRLPNLDVYVHERGGPHLVDPSQLLASVRDATGSRFSEYGTLKPIPEESIITIGDETDFSSGSRKFLAVPTPGHAPHHLAYKDQDSGAVFTGDSAGLYLNGELIPTTTPPSFDLEKSLASLKSIKRISPSVLLYSHFGPGLEPVKMIEKYGDKLREWVDFVATLKEKYGEGERLNREVLSRKREWVEAGVDEEEMIMNINGVLRYLSWKGN